MWKLQQALTSILCDIVRQWGHARAASGVRQLKHWQCVFQELICAPRNLFQLIILSNAFCSCNFFSVKSAIFLYNMHIVFAVMLLLFTCFVVMLSLIMNSTSWKITTAVQVILKYNINNPGNHTNDH